MINELNEKLYNIIQPILKRGKLNDMYKGILTYNEIEEIKKISFELIKIYKEIPKFSNQLNLIYMLLNSLNKGV